MPDYAALRRAMVDCQVRPSDVTRYPLIAAMLSVPREEFVPPQMRDVAYADLPVDLGNGRSQFDPRTFAKMVDALDVGGSDFAMHIGCGLGYGTAVLEELCAFVVAVESDEAMAEAARANLLATDALECVVNTGELAQGAASDDLFDVILVEGAVEHIPDAIEAQLKLGGRIGAIFADGAGGQARIGSRTDSGITWRRAFDATAPLLPGFALEKTFVF